MDNKDTLRNLLIASFIFVGILAFGPRLFPPVPPPSDTRPADAWSDTDQRETGVHPPSAPETGERTAQRQPGGEPGDGFKVIEAESEQTLAMGSAPADSLDPEAPLSPYRMRLILSNVGAAVDTATMTDHAEELHSRERYELLSRLEREDGSVYRSLAIEKINVDGVDLDLYDKKWHAGSVEHHGSGPAAGQSVTFWIEIHQHDAPALRLTRAFTLPAQERQLRRHDLKSDITVENLSAQPHRVILTYRGGLGIRRVNPRFDYRSFDHGIHDGTRVVGARRTRGDVDKSASAIVTLYEPSTAAPQVRFAWAATANTYFTCTIAPTDPGGTGLARYVEKVSALDADGDLRTDDDGTLRFVIGAGSVAPGETLRYPADIYLGEKNGDAFRDVPEYNALNYYYQVSKAYGLCTFTFLVELMIWLLDGLFWIVRDFGVAIVILVLAVRALLHPITKKGQVNMVRMQQRMQEMAPKIEEIKRKYANDKARMNQEMMKLNINPAGQLLTCLPMFIQMPIWIALYISLSNNILMRHESAFYGLTWISDLTAPDALFTFPSPIIVPLAGWALPSFNLLPILLSVFMYMQQKLQPKPKPSPTMTDQQRQQQEMMQKMGPMMSIMMLLIFYKMPSGLNLYIMTSSLFGIIEQHRIRKHIKEQEENGTLHKPPPKKKPEPDRKKKPGRMNFFQKLQKMAEKAKEQQAQRRPKNKVRR